MTEPNWVCVYCGLEEPDVRDRTRDHIPPKNLFPEPRPSNLITVPCYRSCNKSASTDDEYFRWVLIVRNQAGEHPDAQKVFDGSVLRSIGRPEAMGFSTLLQNNTYDLPVYTEGGIYIGETGGFKVDHARVNRVAARIIQGLYSDRYKSRLPDSHKTVCWNDAILAVENQEWVGKFKAFFGPLILEPPERVIGNNVFEYWFQASIDDENSTFWILRFYEDMTFFGGTTSAFN